MNLTVEKILRHSTPDLTDVEVRSTLCSFANKLTSVLSGGEKSRLALAALKVSSTNVLLLDEPTNNLDPVSPAEILGALKGSEGAVVMVTHDHGAVEVLAPERVLLPDGDEDLRNDRCRRDGGSVPRTRDEGPRTCSRRSFTVSRVHP